MKIKTTRKSLTNNYSRIISIGYCDAQYLLQYEEPFAYCCGVYGWSCDNYLIDGTLVSTGYSPIKEKNTKKDYKLIEKYEDKAREIICNYDIDWNTQKTQVKGLLGQLIKELS